MTPRAVFDTSTLVSAALKRTGVPRQAFEYALDFCEVCASLDTSNELEAVLLRTKFDRLRPREDREEFLSIFRDQVHIISILPTQLEDAYPLCRDPKDDIFLSLAHAANAEVLITSDRDLLILHPWNGIDILSPADFLRRFASRS